MAYQRVEENHKLEVGDQVRSHFKVDYPDLIPDALEEKLEEATSWITEHLQEISDKVNNRLTGEAEIEFTNAYYEDKGDFYDLVYEYEVKHTSVLLVGAVVSILTSWEFLVGIGILYFLIQFTGIFKHSFSEIESGPGKLLGIGLLVAIGAFAFSRVRSGGRSIDRSQGYSPH